MGLPLARTDALGNTYTFHRDAFGRPATMTDPLGGVTRLEWGIEGKQAQVREAQPIPKPSPATRVMVPEGQGTLF
ncbi:RHS repeat domain-containing protein [Streptomyces sp. NPDC005774]|uniref:RHS repeat domain-containing protein n=1 Tax=Streptomyces sp. NPDC005774 TaxID=3364728 RepID=UPI003674DA87